MTWRGHKELMEQLGPELARSFAAFAQAQNEMWAQELESGEVKRMGEWLEHRWGNVIVRPGWHPSAREIVVYELTGQYCGSFTYDPDAGTWTDNESGFFWPQPDRVPA